jgi:serine/threonine protein kinase
MAHVVCRQLAEAVSCVHRHGKIHCDIKPANVMLMGGPGTHIRLGDFDVSKDSTRRLDDAVSRARTLDV